MIKQLKARQQLGQPIRVALVGAGSMGIGIALQISLTPGMQLVLVGDLSLDAAQRAADAAAGLACRVTDDILPLLQSGEVPYDVLVESTNAIGPAARYCRAAIAYGAHVVLMNAEVDLALGPLLHREALAHNVVVSSDAGDQHGVIRRMVDEISLWGFEIVQAGNIKGFLDRYATAESLKHEAAKRHLDPIQCCAYTDGTKLNIEMALLSNSLGLRPMIAGMQGPACETVQEVMNRFDLDAHRAVGTIDYILGAEPGGGVYVVGYCEHPLQQQYLEYYKMGEGPYYLFYRPYHLCHLETTRAIAHAVLFKEAVMRPDCGRVSDVFAYAKRDITAGSLIPHGIGGEDFYGLIETVRGVENATLPDSPVPIALLESEGAQAPRLTAPLKKDQPLCWQHIDLPDSDLLQFWHEQAVS